MADVPGSTRLLRRSRTNRVIAGVCGGIGRYLGVDPVLIRVALVVLAIVGAAASCSTSWDGS